MTESKQTRQHSHELLIDAPPEAVWQAITDPDRLVKWFPTLAEVEGGKGGRILYRWRDDWKIACSIQEWSPPRHLRTTWAEGGWSSEKASVPLAVDWHLEGERGRTRLRLVHSGFGASSNWDEEFDGTRRGWDFELLSLKHFLERHPTSERLAFWIRRPTARAQAEAWSRLVGPRGIVSLDDVGSTTPGQILKIHLDKGDPVPASLLTYSPPREVSCVVDAWNKGLFRIGYELGQGNPECQAWVSLWDSTEAQARALQETIGQALSRTCS